MGVFWDRYRCYVTGIPRQKFISHDMITDIGPIIARTVETCMTVSSFIETPPKNGILELRSAGLIIAFLAES